MLTKSRGVHPTVMHIGRRSRTGPAPVAGFIPVRASATASLSPDVLTRPVYRVSAPPPSLPTVATTDDQYLTGPPAPAAVPGPPQVASPVTARAAALIGTDETSGGFTRSGAPTSTAAPVAGSRSSTTLLLVAGAGVVLVVLFASKKGKR